MRLRIVQAMLLLGLFVHESASADLSNPYYAEGRARYLRADYVGSCQYFNAYRQQDQAFLAQPQNAGVRRQIDDMLNYCTQLQSRRVDGLTYGGPPPRDDRCGNNGCQVDAVVGGGRPPR